MATRGFNAPVYSGIGGAGIQIGFERDNSGNIRNPSAIFMSLAIRAGGFPMVKDYDGSDLVPGTPCGSPQGAGWRAKLVDNGLSGTCQWRNHNYPSLDIFTDSGLIGYIRGTSESGGDRISYRSSQLAIRIGVSALLDPNPDAHTLDRIDPERLRAIAAWSGGIVKQGDYMFIDTPEASHGYMVVGFGPPVTCESTVSYSLIGEHFYINAEDAGNVQLVTGRQGTSLIGNIPYVADWGAQRNVARPFYCSNFTDAFDATPNNFSQYNHSFWEFIRVPDVTTVPCGNVFNPNFRVSMFGDITRCN